MKKKSIIATAMILCLASTTAIFSQAANPQDTATLRGGQVTVKYGSPSSKGRDVLALINPGSYWRMGADINTTLTTQTDLRFGEETIPAGSYMLLAHFLEGDNWELIICKGVADGFRPKDTVAVVPFTLEKGGPHVERMKIDLREGMGKSALVLSWGPIQPLRRVHGLIVAPSPKSSCKFLLWILPSSIEKFGMRSTPS